MILMPAIDVLACYAVSLVSEAEKDKRKCPALMRKVVESIRNP